MATQSDDYAPVSCTLSGSDYKTRLTWIADLNALALRRYQRKDLRLELTYAAEGRVQVREMIRHEQECCAFLDFVMEEAGHEITLAITAPERARDTVDEVFAPFLPRTPAAIGCACFGSTP